MMSYGGCLSFLLFFKMGENNLSTLSMNTYFLENRVKICEQQKEAMLICQLGIYYIYIANITKGMASGSCK